MFLTALWNQTYFGRYYSDLGAPSVQIVGVSRGYTDHHQGRAIQMADSRID